MNATWREDNNIYFSTANRIGNGEHAEVENLEEWEGGRRSDKFEIGDWVEVGLIEIKIRPYFTMKEMRIIT